MKIIRIITIFGIVPGLIGCATVPEKSELQRLDRAGVISELEGNTITGRADYGRWADYHETGSTGYAKAWGDWGSQSATSSYQVSDDGQICWTYSGAHEWTTPDHEFCAIVYSDAEGNYYSETTRNTFKPSREGDIKKVELKPGDAYGLSEQ